jgi:amino acid adenylation domain-containing protein
VEVSQAVEGYRLSRQQIRLWAEGRAADLASECCLLVTGAVDLDRLHGSLSAVVEEEPQLRAAFRSLAAMVFPLQTTGASRLDWRILDGGDDRAALLGRMREDTAFELGTDAGLRVRVAPLGREGLLVWARAPRITADALSLLEVCRRWFGRYEDAAPVDPDRVGYGQYAEWQRTDEVAGDPDGVAYWAPRWRALPGPAKAGVSADAPARERRELRWDPLATNGSRPPEASRELLLASWAAVLSRFTGAPEVELDVELAGRHVPELGDVIGLVAECLPVRLRVEGSFEALQAAVARQLDGHEEWFEQVPDHRVTAGRRSGVLFSYVDRPARLHRGSLTVDLLELDSAPSLEHDLRLRVLRTGPDGLSLVLDHDPGRHPRWQAARLLDGLVVLARDGRHRPRTAAADLELLRREEPGSVAVRRARPGDLEAEDTVPALFAAQVRARPETVAVSGPGCRLTYAELDARSDALAAELARAGAGRGRGVGLYAEPSEDAVVGTLAIMKTGGFSVPLDPRDPDARLAALVGDAGIAVIAASRDAHGTSRLESLPSAPVVTSIGGRDGGTPPSPGPGSRDAAYVIYTSGSTGRPRGVVVEQRGLVSYLRWVNETVGRDVIIPATTRLGFDACLKQLLAPLLAGRTVTVLSEAARTDAEALYEELTGIPRLALNCVPGLWEELLEVAGRDPGNRLAPALVRLLLGGERIPDGVVRRTAELFPAVEVWNLYGPTEATANACAGRQLPGAPVRIGHPISGATAHVLDHLLRPVPAGFPGSLFIGGLGVARGYLGAPAATAARFVPDPFGAEPGARLYDSGDVVRADDTGALEFLARRDFQVKLRGFRVEIEEIEEALRRCTGVRDAAVVPLDLPDGGAQIVACVTEREAGLSADAVKRQLAGVLPHYMVPAAVRVVRELPRTAAGKLDRAALRETVAAPDGARGRDEPYESEAETALAAMWGTVLGRAPAAPSDNFFDLGGHSLLVVRLTWRVREAFGVDLPARALFDHPVLRQYALLVRSARSAPAAAAERIPEVERGGPLPVSFAQHRFWFLDRLDPTSPVHNILAARRVTGPLDVLRLQRALDAVVTRHEVLRMRFIQAGGRPMQVPEARASVPLTLVDLSDLSAADRVVEARRQVMAACAQPFDLKRAPALRAVLVRTGDEEAILALVIHHAVADGPSKGLLFADLAAAYDGPLAPPGLQYADYAAWQRGRVDEGALERDMAYWRERLADLPAARLPGGRASRAGFEGARLHRALPEDVTARIRQLAADRGATVFMAVLAAFAGLLHRLTGSADVAVGTPVDARDRPELEGVIGCFSSTLVLRTNLRGDPAFADVVDRVRSTALDAYEHAAVPLEMHGAVARMVAGSDGERVPLISFLFAMLPEPPPPLTAGRLTWSEEDVDNGLSEHDLALAVRDAGERLELYLTFPGSLLGEDEAARLLDWLETALATVSERPDTPLSGLDAPVPPDPPRKTVPATPDDELLGTLTAIWRELFDRESVGVDDDFFELGGHSLIALVMVERVEETFAVELPLSEIFDRPTIRTLAESIESLRTAAVPS